MLKTQPHTAAAVPNPPPQQMIMQMLMGMWSAQAIATAARLGIADALAHAPPQESTALARAVGADAAALARLLRTLVSLGVLVQPHPSTYALTPLGELLRSDVPRSMRDFLIALTDTPHWQAWGKLHESVRSGQPMVPQLFGMPLFAYYAAHPEDLAAFSRAMGNLSALAAQGTVQHYDFSHARHGLRSATYRRSRTPGAHRPRLLRAVCNSRGGFLSAGAPRWGPLLAQAHFA